MWSLGSSKKESPATSPGPREVEKLVKSLCREAGAASLPGCLLYSRGLVIIVNIMVAYTFLGRYSYRIICPNMLQYDFGNCF